MRRAFLCLILTLATFGVNGATAQPVSAVEQARVERAGALQKILLATMEEAYRHAGVWPATLAPIAAAKQDLVYEPPDAVADATQAEDLAPGTVVLHERFDQHPDGIWVGYADGHLEFVTTAAGLAGCEEQLPIIRAAIASYGRPTGRQRTRDFRPEASAAQVAHVAGNLTLRVVDPKGQAVAGALVGVQGFFGDENQPVDRVVLEDSDGKNHPLITDSQGLVTLPAKRVFSPTGYGSVYLDVDSAPLWILKESDSLAALGELHLSDFASNQTRQVSSQQVCQVTVLVTSIGLRSLGQNMGSTECDAMTPGHDVIRAVFSAASPQKQLDFPLPPGDYGLEFEAHGCSVAWRYVHIAAAEPPLNFQIDLRPRPILSMYGHPAPELRSIKGWKNGGPLRLADLRGKIVLLDFWGYWCGPCVASMPTLMKLNDQFKNSGLVIITVHDDSVASIAEMDQKLATARKNIWQGRDLPFPVALDGGGETRIKYTAQLERGATTAAYGVTYFPTTFVIGRDGNVLITLDVLDPKFSDQMARILGEPTAP